MKWSPGFVVLSFGYGISVGVLISHIYLYSLGLHRWHWDGGMVANNTITGLIVGLRSANERRRYFVTTSLFGWAQA